MPCIWCLRHHRKIICIRPTIYRRAKLKGIDPCKSGELQWRLCLRPIIVPRNLIPIQQS